MSGTQSTGVDVCIIGAGAIGLAVAAELARDRSVAVLERHDRPGLETSSHNSGVIHAGLYYPRDWLKTTLCVEGNRLLYAWAERHNVRSRRTGKLVIAVEESEMPALEQLQSAARENGVPGLKLLGAAAVRNLEPHVRAVAGLLSPTSGVIDQMGLMASYRAAAEEAGALLAFRHDIESIERRAGDFMVRGRGPDGEPFAIQAEIVVNSAGLHTDALAATLGCAVDGDETTPRLRQTVNKGRYYDVVTPEKARRVRRLIYPLPHSDRAGLGVHLTVDVDGGAHLGPDTEWLTPGTALDYRADDARRDAFLESARRFLPWLDRDDLAPGLVGYRPKLSGPGEPPADFLIWVDRGYVHLGGMESPGLTASLAIARRVRAHLH